MSNEIIHSVVFEVQGGVDDNGAAKALKALIAQAKELEGKIAQSLAADNSASTKELKDALLAINETLKTLQVNAKKATSAVSDGSKNAAKDLKALHDAYLDGQRKEWEAADKLSKKLKDKDNEVVSSRKAAIDKAFADAEKAREREDKANKRAMDKEVANFEAAKEKEIAAAKKAREKAIEAAEKEAGSRSGIEGGVKAKIKDLEAQRSSAVDEAEIGRINKELADLQARLKEIKAIGLTIPTKELPAPPKEGSEGYFREQIKSLSAEKAQLSATDPNDSARIAEINNKIIELKDNIKSINAIGIDIREEEVVGTINKLQVQLASLKAEVAGVDIVDDASANEVVRLNGVIAETQSLLRALKSNSTVSIQIDGLGNLRTTSGLIGEVERKISELEANKTKIVDPVELDKANKELAELKGELTRLNGITKIAPIDDDNLANSGSLLQSLQNELEDLKRAAMDVQLVDPNAEMKLRDIANKMGAVQKRMLELTSTSSRSMMGVTNLGYSASQVLREAPAFLYGLNTGIMALSNNLPILVDDFKAAQAVAKEMGKSGAAAWAEMGKQIFSVAGMMTLAVVAIQVFMKYIDEAEKEFSELDKKIDEATKRDRELVIELRVEKRQFVEDVKRLLKAAREDNLGDNVPFEMLKKANANILKDITSISQITPEIEESLIRQGELTKELANYQKRLNGFIEKEEEIRARMAKGASLTNKIVGFTDVLLFGKDAKSFSVGVTWEAKKRELEGQLADLEAQKAIAESEYNTAVRRIKSDNTDDKNDPKKTKGKEATDMTEELSKQLRELERYEGFFADFRTNAFLSRDANNELSESLIENNIKRAKALKLQKEGLLLNASETFALLDAVDARLKYNAQIKLGIDQILNEQKARQATITSIKEEYALIAEVSKRRIEELESEGMDAVGERINHEKTLTGKLLAEEEDRYNNSKINLENRINDLKAEKSLSDQEVELKEKLTEQLAALEFNHVNVVESIKDMEGDRIAKAIKDNYKVVIDAAKGANEVEFTEAEANINRLLGLHKDFSTKRLQLLHDQYREQDKLRVKNAEAEMEAANSRLNDLRTRRKGGEKIPQPDINEAQAAANKASANYNSAVQTKESRDKGITGAEKFFLGESAVGKTEHERRIGMINAVADAYEELARTAINAANMVLEVQQKNLDREIDIRKTNVGYAIELAKRGNTTILNEERARLNASVRERRKAANAQIAVNTAMIISESILAVARAAAEGGGFGSVATVLATVGAIAGGIAAVTAMSTNASVGYFDGGYTGDGNPRGEAGVVHNQEIVFSKKNIAALGGKDVVEGIRTGKNFPYIIAGTQMASEDNIWRLEAKFDALMGVVEASKLKQDIFFDEHGVGMMTQKAINKDRRRFVG